jgi:ribonuclease P protein component
LLPSRERLTRSSLFQRAYTARKSISSPLFTLYVVPRFKQAGGGHHKKSMGAAQKHSENGAEMPSKAQTLVRMPLVGFVVAKKVCKSAVVRNRAKRRIREAYRLLRHTEAADAMALSQWYALAWVVHDKALGASWQEIQQTVTECLKKANARYGSGVRAPKSEPDRGERQ